jgi:hypothetical protein
MDSDRPSGPLTISFSQPVSAFGAYWGSGVDCYGDPPSILTFRDVAGNIVGTDTFTYEGNGWLAWHGYRFGTPVKTITRIAGDGLEGVAIDGLESRVASSPTPPVTGPPVVTTSPATFIASFSARLDGSLNPHGLATTFHFQYGTTTSYGLTTAPRTQTGNMSRNVSANISSLTATTTYHFRIVASNMAGTRMGGDRTFTTLTATGFPIVTTNPATNVTASAATLHGSLDPHGLATTVHFQYGRTTSYGHTTAMQSQTGNTYRNIAANIGGLTAHTSYHFRIVATNSAGTRMGSDRTITTP